MDILRSLFSTFCSDPDDIEARCLLAFSLLIGNYFITASHPSRTREDVLKRALAQLGSSGCGRMPGLFRSRGTV